MTAINPNDKVVKAIVKARKGDAKWKEIAEEHDMTVGRAIFLHECATVSDDDLVDPEATDATIRKAIVRMRDKQNLSWGQISARLGRGAIGHGRAQTIYFEAGGDNVNVQRGGRYPEGKSQKDIRPDLEGKGAKPAKKPAKKTAKKAGAKKAAAKSGGKNIADMTPAQVVKAAKGKFLHTTDGDKLKVTEISESNGMFEVIDAEGDEWGLEQSEMAKITAR